MISSGIEPATCALSKIFLGHIETGAWDWQSHRHLWVNCLDLENVWTSTSHILMGLQGQLQRYFYVVAFTVNYENEQNNLFY
jgi:hypothetical protein